MSGDTFLSQSPTIFSSVSPLIALCFLRSQERIALNHAQTRNSIMRSKKLKAGLTATATATRHEQIKT
ncbi:hypothetical protein KIN20_004282 [Parelaphostrongylus tenuis]|uniref:Uncharacterized protein n=1 Tax=Parelaphostrongylus tenuis TaxID=148309 RepID=A0AAD5QJ66_PARTN|nr:hypothetical protein KIN20_004282 [Parelaphostrongylus tenuis]